MPYKVEKPGRKLRWAASVMKEGKRVQKMFDTKKEALAWESEQRKLESFTTPTDSLTNLEWSNQYLDYCQRFSKNTVWEKTATFKALFKVVKPDGHPADITSGQALKALQPVAKRQSGNTANKMRKNLVAGWNWGIKYLGLPKINPFLIDRFPEERHPRHIPTEDEFWKAFDAASEYDQRMLLAYLHTGARKKELFSLTWSDVDVDQQRIRLWTSKRKGGTKEFNWIPMTDDLMDALAEHRKHVHGDLVFPNPELGETYTSRQHYLERLCKRAGVQKFCWHAIRHLTASILIKNGVPLPTIQKILRHKNLTTTQRYVHELDSSRDLMKVLSRNRNGIDEAGNGDGRNEKTSHEAQARGRSNDEARI
jgi:integrase